MSRLQSLVSSKWLHNALQQGNKFSKVRVLDSTGATKNALANYQKSHIPGALYFDIEECRDKSSSFPHMLPSVLDFQRYVGDLGICNKSHVIVYDTADSFGFFSAQRAWWMFRVFGHEQVSVLNGGFTGWCDAGYETTDIVDKVPSQTFKACFHPELVKSFEDMIENQDKNHFQVVDARSRGRFIGSEPEPRKEIQPGHIRGAVSIPYRELVNPNTREIKSQEALETIFNTAGIDLNKPLVASCGSGVTACCLAFAASLCGKEDVAVYDGSWTEFYPRSTPEQRVCPHDKECALDNGKTGG